MDGGVVRSASVSSGSAALGIAAFGLVRRYIVMPKTGGFDSGLAYRIC